MLGEVRRAGFDRRGLGRREGDAELAEAPDQADDDLVPGPGEGGEIGGLHEEDQLEVDRRRAEPDRLAAVELRLRLGGDDPLHLAGQGRDQIGPGETQRWLAGAAAGQTMLVQVTSDSGNAWFQITDPNGATLVPEQNPATVELPISGDYTIAISNLSSTVDTYVLTVVIG